MKMDADSYMKVVLIYITVRNSLNKTTLNYIKLSNCTIKFYDKMIMLHEEYVIVKCARYSDLYTSVYLLVKQFSF